MDLVLILSRSWASLAGDVDASSAHVVLLSEEQSLPPQANYQFPELDQLNHFFVSKLPPGKYLAFATEDADSEWWDNPAFVKALRSEGQALELHENQRAALHLKLIPKDETDQIAKRLGL